MQAIFIIVWSWTENELAKRSEEKKPTDGQHANQADFGTPAQ